MVGRFTGYDQDFESYDGNDDSTRQWGSIGARIDTQFNRTYDWAESQLFDIHRIRHIIEPNLTLFESGSSIHSSELPIYDPDVEDIQDGPGAKLGLRNIFQTQRGGPGQWRSEDWLVIDTDLNFQGNANAITDNELARFIDYRPEDSIGGDNFHSDARWMVSDTLAAIGEITEDLNTGEVVEPLPEYRGGVIQKVISLNTGYIEQWRVGGVLQHSPVLTSFLSFTDIHTLDSRQVAWGFNYQLTAKYQLGFTHTIDVGHTNSQDLNVTLTRKIPGWRVVVLAHYDPLDDDHRVRVRADPRRRVLREAQRSLCHQAVGSVVAKPDCQRT